MIRLLRSVLSIAMVALMGLAFFGQSSQAQVLNYDRLLNLRGGGLLQ
ncbi:MAG: hypothetical protein AAGJ28_17125 [Pseudomonadota bacterium]